MQKTINDENTYNCAVCCKDINRNNLKAGKVDGLWGCSSDCINKILKEKKNWTPKGWDALCKVQALYEERKQAKINTTRTAVSV